jgi:hypothetical protein
MLSALNSEVLQYGQIHNTMILYTVACWYMTNYTITIVQKNRYLVVLIHRPSLMLSEDFNYNNNLIGQLRNQLHTFLYRLLAH